MSLVASDPDAAHRTATPLDDPARLAELKRYDVFSAPERETLTALLQTVARLTGVPNVALNIIDDRHQTPLASVGMPSEQLPATDGFCHLVVQSAAALYTQDASKDSRFAASPFVAGDDPAVRLYAAAPLTAESGDVLGALCIYDQNAGTIEDWQLDILRVLADHVMEILTLRLTQRLLTQQLSRAEQAEERQRRLLEASPDAFVGLEADGTVAEWSPSATRLFGHAASDAVGRRVTDLLVPADDRHALQQSLANAAAKGGIENSSRRLDLVRGDGERRCFELTLWTESHPQFRIYVLARDITTADVASRRLEEAEELWRLSFDDAPTGMTIQRIENGESRYERVNHAMCELTGYSAVELIDLGPRRITHPDDVEGDRDLLAEIGATGMTEVMRTKRYVHASGKNIHVSVSVSVTVVNGVELVITQVRDVTELRATLASLQEKALLLDLTREAVFVRRMDGTVTFWNRGAEEVYGIPASRAIGRVTHVLLETEFPRPFEVIQQELIDEGHWEGLLVHTDADGVRKTVMSRWAYYEDEVGEQSILEINSDVTAEAQARARQATAEALFEMAFVHSPIGVGILGTTSAGRGRWLQTNDALRSLVSNGADLDNCPVASLFDPEDARQIVRGLNELFEGRESEWNADWRVPTSGGHRYLSARCVAIDRIDGGEVDRIVVVQLEDVTRRRAHETWLRGQAVNDALTGLPNRIAVGEVIESELSGLADHGESLAVLFVDLDGFKAVNDVHGHAAGDQVLTTVARQLRSSAPEHATVARLGGDEFVIVVPRLEEQAASHLAQRLRETTAVRYGSGPDETRVTASIGWATTADPSTASQSLLGAADASMYEAKRARRDAAGTRAKA